MQLRQYGMEKRARTNSLQSTSPFTKMMMLTMTMMMMMMMMMLIDAPSHHCLCWNASHSDHPRLIRWSYQENTMNITTWHYHRTPTLTCSPLCVWATLPLCILHSCLQRSLYTCVRCGGTFCDLSSIQMECHSVL